MQYPDLIPTHLQPATTCQKLDVTFPLKFPVKPDPSCSQKSLEIYENKTGNRKIVTLSQQIAPCLNRYRQFVPDTQLPAFLPLQSYNASSMAVNLTCKNIQRAVQVMTEEIGDLLSNYKSIQSLLFRVDHAIEYSRYQLNEAFATNTLLYYNYVELNVRYRELEIRNQDQHNQIQDLKQDKKELKNKVKRLKYLLKATDYQETHHSQPSQPFKDEDVLLGFFSI